jgi:hypothetical protein
MFGKSSFIVTVFIFSFTLTTGVIFFAQATTKQVEPLVAHPQEIHKDTPQGNHVIVLLDDMKIILKNGTTTIDTVAIVSKGRPSSYYETIGGIYTSAYKEPLHFSSIGHVYMPYSIHVFGNYFIHGIPYYEDGTKVSSTYSGGCIRLEDADAKKVYDFITQQTPLYLVHSDIYEFYPTASSTQLISNATSTMFMTAIISLEALKQDSPVTDSDGQETTRRKLLPRLMKHDTDVATLYASSIGHSAFVSLMNQKASSLGLTNTTFTSPTGNATTTQEDLDKLYRYITSYKSYLLSVVSEETN